VSPDERAVTARPRVLAIHPGALGDVLQAVPALRALGADARVTFCGQPRLGELLAGAGVVREAVSFDTFGLEALFSEESVPVGLTGRLGDFAAVVSWFGSGDARYCERIGALPAAVVAPAVPGNERIVAVWQHLLATLDPIRGRLTRPPAEGLEAARKRPLRAESATLVDGRAALALPGPWRASAERALAEAGARPDRPLLVVHPGAGGRWKLASPALLAGAIAQALGAGDTEVLVHIGPADGDAAMRLIDALARPPRRLIEPPLPTLAGVLQRSHAFLGADSGVSHLAAAVGTPAVILFPAATRERWAPWSRSATLIDLDQEEGAAVAATAAALRGAMGARGDRDCAGAGDEDAPAPPR